MPTGDDFVGVGVPAQLATLIGNDPKALTATGTSQTTAATVLTHNTEIVTAASNTGVIVPASSKIGTPFYFFTSSATTAVIYAPVGQTLNGSLNGSLNLVQNKFAFLFQYKKGFWASNLTA